MRRSSSVKMNCKRRNTQGKKHVNLEYWGFALAEGRYGFGEGETEGSNFPRVEKLQMLGSKLTWFSGEASIEQHFQSSAADLE